MSLEQIKQSLHDAPVIKKGEYEYIIHPLIDGIPEVQPEMLREVVLEMKKHIEQVLPIDKIVTIEAMGIPYATALSLEMNIPFTIIRKRKYELPGEMCVEQKTGYSSSKLYINGLKKGDRVVIVDDLISTGGTLKSLIHVLEKKEIIIKNMVIAVKKGDYSKVINNIHSIIDI